MGRPLCPRKKNSRPAAPADPQAHVERVGHDVAGPHSHRYVPSAPAFSLGTCTPVKWPMVILAADVLAAEWPGNIFT